MKRKLCAIVLGILAVMSIAACGTNSNARGTSSRSNEEQDAMTDLTKAAAVASAMAADGKTEEEARKSLDWNDDDTYTDTVEITYGSVNIEIPE